MVVYIAIKVNVVSNFQVGRLEVVNIFEKTLIGGFSGVNRRLAFDSEFKFYYQKMKDKKFKPIYDLKINNKKENKRIVTKILKIDEKKKQYGNTMTKPLP